MLRNALNSVLQKKFFLMFFTCVIYIVGLFAYFGGFGIYAAAILMFIGVLSILKNYLSPKLVLFWYFTFFFAFFNAFYRIKNTDFLYQVAPQDAVLTGQISSIPAENSPAKFRFFFDVTEIKYGAKSEKIHAKTLVNAYNYDSKEKFNVGDYYEIKGKLRSPFEATNPSQFDYGKYLRNFGVFSVFYAENADYKKLDTVLSPKWRFIQGLNNVRNNIIKSHAKYLKSPNLEILGGIVFGDDAVTPPEDVKNSFVNSGLLHILAASGMNVAIIYGIWFYILRKLRVPFNLSVSSGIFVVIFYALMTGLGPSVIRAAVMLIFILIGKLIDRDAHSVSLLSFVALLMLIYNPSYINDVGFQLSFLVTFGLLTLAPGIFEKFKSVPGWILGTVLIPVIAQIWVAPIQMYYFNSFSLYSVFANIITVPFVTVISFGGFVSSVLALIKPLSASICFIFDVVLNPFLSALVFVSKWFSSLPHSLIQTPKPLISQIFLYYSIILLLTLALAIEKNKKLLQVSLLLTIFLLISFIPVFSPKFETIAFDVQNADAFLITTPNGKYFIVDTGKMPYRAGKSQAKAIILEYLKDKGINKIEGLIITHFDSDHAGGAEDLIKNLDIKTVYVNSLEDKSRLAQNIYKVGADKIRLAKNSETIYQEGRDFSVKTYMANISGDEFENENSVITLFSHKNFDELFMGDAGVEAFRKISKDLPKKIEILKVGHHGAKNVVDSNMIKSINPNYAVISTGLNNYGHPNGVTVDILEQNGVKILRTDRHNSIKIDEVNEKYKVYSYSDGKYIEMERSSKGSKIL